MENNLINVFNNSYPYEEYKHVLDEPLDADLKTKLNTEDEYPDYQNHYPHYQNSYMITNDKIIPSHQNIMIKHKINCLYFVYTDFGEKEFDNKYWFFIGELNNNLYFSYEVGISGTGFGLGETSVIHFSKTKELLLSHGLTNKQRNLIKLNLSHPSNNPSNNPSLIPTVIPTV